MHPFQRPIKPIRLGFVPITDLLDFYELFKGVEESHDDDLSAAQWVKAAEARGVPMKPCPECDEDDPDRNCIMCGGEGHVPGIDWTGTDDYF